MSKKLDELDVSGLLASENGQQCRLHEVCGQAVVEGVLVCWWAPVTVDGKQEMGIAVHLVLENGKDGCCIGFLKHHMKVKHALLEGVTARVVRVLTTDSEAMPVQSEHAFVHHNKGSCKVVCTTEWNEVKSEDRKRPIDSGVLLIPRNKKNKNKIVIGEQSDVKK